MHKITPPPWIADKIGPAAVFLGNQGGRQIIEPRQFPFEQILREPLAHRKRDHQRHHHDDQNSGRPDGREYLGEQGLTNKVHINIMT
ncbi:hypothetical protein [Antarcticimicrobium sediminis]|uniref:hypothetical protein n=1 Tax=Antarcticimicrobium sediminis TaxID=2546227 RepID=UPI001404CD25|nr:hypothetical protein [Antarcticimicrobium sediminis]